VGLRQSLDSIAAFFQGRSLADYAADLKLRSAVERQLEITGEALNRLSRESPEIVALLPDLRRAIAMRNALIHGYRQVDNATVWKTVHENLPTLQLQVEVLLNDLGEHP
jgi:uncharacterized protein with HEPN domain